MFKKLLKTALWLLVGVTALGLVAFALLFLVFDRNLYSPADAPAPELVIRGGTLFDATGRAPFANQTLIIRDGAIACIGPQCTAAADAREIDATGLSIVPGLIDLHVHLLAITGDNVDRSMPALVWNYAQMRPDVRRKLLEAGVTSVRDVGGPQDFMLEFANAVRSGELAGPRLFVSGAMITAPGGHPAYGGADPNPIGFGGNMAFQSNDPAAIRAEVGRQAARGVDGIKAVFHGAVSDSGEVLLPSLSADSLQALIDAARAHGLWVAVHVGPNDEAAVAAQLGATTVEHGTRMGNLVNEQTLRQLTLADVVYVPTLGREPQGYLNVPALYAAGVRIGVGTDTNNPEMFFGDSYHRELERLTDAGMPPEAVLIAATRTGAAGLGAADSLGTIEAGRLADIVIVRGDPWRDIGALRNVEWVVAAGRVMVEPDGER